MAVKTKVWDAAEHLDSEEAAFAYVNAAFEEGDPALIAAAIGDVARARGMTDVARLTGMSRESLYKALSADGNPQLGTIMKVLKALHLKISVTADHDADAGPGQAAHAQVAGFKG